MASVTARVRRLPAYAHSATTLAAGTWVGLVVLLGVASLMIYLAGRGSTFFRDDWNFLLLRRGHSIDTILRPHNGHPVPLHVLAYKGLQETVGLKSYLPYQALSLTLHAAVGALLFVFARRRVGALAALAVTAVFVVPGAGSDEVLWPFQIGFLGSLAAGIGALLALERRDARGDLIASGLLLIALASSGLGVAMAVAAFVEIVLGPEPRRRLVRVLALPVGLYGIWHLVYGGEVPTELIPATELAVEQPFGENLVDAPRYVFNSAGTALAATVGLEAGYAPPLALAAAAILVIRLTRGGPVSPRLWALIALPLVYWSLLALARGQFNDFAAPRYVYPGVLFILLVLVESARGIRLSNRGLALGAVATAAIVTGNAGILRDQGQGFQDKARDLLPRLAALELARDHVSPSFKPHPDPLGTAPDVVAGPYFAAVDDFGSPAPTATELSRRSEAERAVADATLVQALEIRPLPGARAGRRAPPPQIITAQGGAAQTDGGCVVLRPSAGRATVELRVSTRALAYRTRPGAPVELRARRLADGFGAPFATVPGGQSGVLRFPPDRLRRPWSLQMAASQQVAACAAAG